MIPQAQGAASVSEGMAVLEEQYELFNAEVQKLPVVLENMITANMEPLKEGIDQLVTADATLNAGIKEYTEGVQAVKEGYDALYTAFGQVTEGAASLAEGAEALAEGNSALADGSKELYSGTKSLTSGAEQLLRLKKTGIRAGSAAKGASQLSPAPAAWQGAQMRCVRAQAPSTRNHHAAGRCDTAL